ncbi:bifunctional diaminohydroxyphosphoribosylaminopyrimidine deaminase/5-amino-6-(5-phosphoribosylamino)uracil reductase RibD [Vibrio gallicus]|uniref:bifunctional diaminohydroxyphosphoribosylaminopyrimidine deaminase/5-amino-6-(5-phosphoribosylamino)uracil reductase RibD n=1 Tax=Vibrio gallicus TaxID=190897 RepID=UPI0021C41F61|nr:bifunctional diaminohydroxyphosphoribosylaminopyrimidine deaminase/5-amino-6-(5-phosphoribosylamino)uracil reductase RibD [Vibrio gallicus]
MPFSVFDHQMMARAITLAEKGKFTTHPNPNVGCVIVQEDQVVGEGFHIKAGGPHAEVHALNQAQALAQGATVYVTLEPCSHYGRTPPCAQALVEAKVARVVCAMQDPNPQVGGRGFNLLRDAGIEVEVGLLEQDAERINKPFLKKMRSNMPYVQLKLAASLDGKTALANGKSKWITGPAARADVQRYRAQAGAILSTSRTVIDDDASLNVRADELPASVMSKYPTKDIRQPLRVILDRRGQLEESLKLFTGKGGELMIIAEDTMVGVGEQEIDLPQLLANLAKEHNINHLWVEAGATLAASMIEQKLVDELVLYLAPKLMGADARGLVNLFGLQEMSEAVDLKIAEVTPIGEDIKIVAHLS